MADNLQSTYQRWLTGKENNIQGIDICKSEDPDSIHKTNQSGDVFTIKWPYGHPTEGEPGIPGKEAQSVKAGILEESRVVEDWPIQDVWNVQEIEGGFQEGQDVEQNLGRIENDVQTSESYLLGVKWPLNVSAFQLHEQQGTTVH